jgi:hypothetical protein
MEQVRRSDYYSQLYRLLGNDGGIEQQLKSVVPISDEVENLAENTVVSADSDLQ